MSSLPRISGRECVKALERAEFVRQKSGDSVEKTVRKYSLKDPQQDLDDKKFWRRQSYEYKILVLENLRLAWSKLNLQGRKNGNIKGFRRVLRVAKKRISS